MGKWLAGILAALVTGLIMWWLTHEGGPLNPKRPEVRHYPSPAHVTITDFEFHITWSPQNYSTSAKYKVYNDGEVSAEGCQILVGHENPLKSYGSWTAPFAVPPKQSSQVSSHINDLFSLSHSGQVVRVVAQVWCKNNVQSDTVESSLLFQEGANQ